MSDEPIPSTEADATGPDQEVILTALKAVKDPEIGINIVDLGLIYAVRNREGEVDVEMTLTTPACPAGPQILREATEVIESLQGVSKANVKLVMSPPWSPDRMSEDARDELGMF
ncbi:metal-sulfur cluster assembly factor [Tautonia sociabilis]|uniref:Metal-sulfur cluster assembly factor n=1 Tax=Tautonia sociabilis TaxID=2080755 RepID=A0A432MPB4_9BACT|nr:metal-sulfur cluster assembly factor [Tautonia sociabilis]RUL89274.1 metal-sulfur cluster assembly factor [Tautonia sociabilis]